jgi:hypothetical protein
MAEEKIVDMLDVFERMVFEAGRLSVMISKAKDAENHKARVRFEKVASLLDVMIATCRKNLTPDNLMDVLERINIDKTFEEIEKSIEVNIESMEKNFLKINKFLKTQS